MSSVIVLSGYITDIFQTEFVTEKFKKRLFWLKETDEVKRPNHWQIELNHTHCDDIDNYQVGDHVSCACDVTGSQYIKNGKTMMFVNLKCLNIEYYGGKPAKEGVIKAKAPRHEVDKASGTQPYNQIDEINNPDYIDDLPF